MSGLESRVEVESGSSNPRTTHEMIQPGFFTLGEERAVVAPWLIGDLE